MKYLAIFGAGVIGAQIRDYNPVCFIDNDPNKQKALFYGYKVLSFEAFKKKYPEATIIIAAKRYFDEIFEQVFPYYTDVYRASLPLADLEQLNIVVTTRCTLKCTHCSSLMPFYKHPKDADLKKVIIYIDKLFKCIDSIGRIEVLGGEPFLHKDLPKLIKKLKTYQIREINVVTNGTIVPKDVTYLKDPKICVVINTYGTKVPQLASKLDKAGVSYIKSTHLAWADLGWFQKRNRTKPDLEELFRRCNFNTCTELLEGELHRCPRSSHGMQLGLIPVNSDFVKMTDKDLKDKIKKLMNLKSIGACNYCDGNIKETLIMEPGK